jgi:hypothetical protein
VMPLERSSSSFLLSWDLPPPLLTFIYLRSCMYHVVVHQVLLFNCNRKREVVVEIIWDCLLVCCLCGGCIKTVLRMDFRLSFCHCFTMHCLDTRAMLPDTSLWTATNCTPKAIWYVCDEPFLLLHRDLLLHMREQTNLHTFQWRSGNKHLDPKSKPNACVFCIGEGTPLGVFFDLMGWQRLIARVWAQKIQADPRIPSPTLVNILTFRNVTKWKVSENMFLEIFCLGKCIELHKLRRLLWWCYFVLLLFFCSF